MDAAGHTLDATVYPETDDMGEHEVQRYISELLRALVVYWFATNQRVGHAGANQFFYWIQGDPTKSRAPDVYVIDGLPQDHPDQGVWKTWEGHFPAFALEVVSSRRRKDYDEAPTDYDAMGTQELLLFDPAATARSRKRVRWQVFRRVRGKLKRVAMSKADRVESRYLGCFVRAVTERGNTRLRLATGRRGDEFVPTESERLARAEVEAERAEAEAERAEAEAERADAAERQALTERIARETLAVQLQSERDARAEAEVALARALEELDRLRRGSA
jgi:Uma2 family endonuclease